MTEPARTAATDGDARPSPSDVLVEQATRLLGAVVERALGRVADQATGLTDRLSGVAQNGGTGLMSAVTGRDSSGSSDEEGSSGGVGSALSRGMTGIKDKVMGVFGGGEDGEGGGGGGGGTGGKGLKITNIVENVDLGLPLRLTYNQWTQFQDFPNMMKKVESVNQESDEKLNWTAKVFWSRRSWNATIVEQIADRHIVWRSEGAKGSVDGAVTFSELAPNLTRVLVVLEYTPKGLFEYTGNLWRAVGRRARLELKHFRRHAMTRSLLEREEIEGWRGEIRDSEVVKTHEEALEEERAREDEDSGEAAYDDSGDEGSGDEDSGDEDWADDEYDEDADEEEGDEDEDVDEAEDSADDADEDEDTDEDTDEDEEPVRQPARAGGRRR